MDRLGAAILMNGLGQAMASERAAAGSSPGDQRESAHHLLYANLERWLCRTGGVYEPQADRVDLLKAIVEGSESS